MGMPVLEQFRFEGFEPKTHLFMQGLHVICGRVLGVSDEGGQSTQVQRRHGLEKVLPIDRSAVEGHGEIMQDSDPEIGREPEGFRGVQC